MISFKNIHKNYGQFKVLENLSVDFPKGKITSLIGGNGAGKSTLLSVAGKLLNQDSGKVFVVDKDIAHISSKEFATRVSFLKQSNHTHIRLKVRELVCFGRFPHNRGKRMCAEDYQFVDQALKFMELEESADKYLDELSGGQRQRAYLAMILAQNTEYVLLDEPLNNLDMKYSVQIMKTLRSLAHKFGKTVVLIVHDINIAAYYSDYIAAIKNGAVKYFGTTESIIKPEILKEVFDLEFEVLQKNGRPVCLFFN